MVHSGAGHPVCCGQEMELLKEKTQDTGFEKHVPVIEKTADGVKVIVGSIPHPMEEEHYIEWIELISANSAHKDFLKPGKASQTEFTKNVQDCEVRAYCNLHGLWKAPNTI